MHSCVIPVNCLSMLGSKFSVAIKNVYILNHELFSCKKRAPSLSQNISMKMCIRNAAFDHPMTPLSHDESGRVR